MKEGALGAAFRKGLDQIHDWNTWLEDYYGSLAETFAKCKCTIPDKNLPKEFCHLDRSRIHYVVVAGKRSDFNEKTRRIHRTMQKDSATRILHYDNIVDTSQDLTLNETTY